MIPHDDYNKKGGGGENMVKLNAAMTDKPPAFRFYRSRFTVYRSP
jgi:hypothetical protein